MIKIVLLNKIFSNCLFLLAFSIFLLTSCHHETYKNVLKDPSPYFTNFMAGTEDAVLRDVDFNMTADEIKKAEKAKLYETTADHLFYEFSYPKDSTTGGEYANVQYFFDENDQLDIITTDIYLSDSLQEAKLRKTFTEYYNQRYGKPETDDYDYKVWNGSFKDKKSDKKYKYTVAVKELEDDFGLKLEYMRE